MRQLSFFALLQLLLASTIHALQPSSTLSGTRQKALLSLSQWKTALHARRPPPEYWEEEEDLDFRRRPPYSEPRNQAPMQYSEEEEEGGNYWSNPPARYDPVQSRGDRVPRPDEPPRMRRNQQQQQGPPPPRRGRRRSTFRSGTPAPPPAIGDFYNQLFWYGIDEDESPADKTMFGGTKGKFNGLAYLGKPPPENFRMGDGYYHEEGNRRPFDYDEGGPNRRRKGPVSTRIEENLNWQKEAGRKRRGGKNVFQGGDIGNSQQEANGYDNFGARESQSRSLTEDWAAKKVANWFRADGGGDDYYGVRDDQYEQPAYETRRRPRQPYSSWQNPVDAFSSVFFGADRRELDRQAEAYNQNMGIGSKGDRKAGPGPRQEQKKGYAYRYDADDLDDGPIVDADVIVSDVDDTKEELAEKEKEPKKVTVDSKTKETGSAGARTEEMPKEKRPNIPNIPKTDQKTQKPWKQDRKQNRETQKAKASKADDWEQRALARDRIPPKVPAWGPNGDLGMDAQEKAYYDAMQEVSEAEIRLEQRKKQLEEAEETIEILKFDIKREKRRIARNKYDERIMRDDVRAMELELHDAELQKRRAHDRVGHAEDRLSGLKDWYGSLLTVYNHSQAKAAVNEALREFHQNEPAARNVNRATQNNSEATTIKRPHLPY